MAENVYKNFITIDGTHDTKRRYEKMLKRIKDIGLWAAAIFFSTVIICTFFVAVGFMVLQIKEWCV